VTQEHLLLPGPGSMLGPTCEPDCPACAAKSEREQKLIDGVREIVLGMWLEAIAAGERDLERALRDLAGPLAKLSFWDRSRIGWQFVEKVRATKVRKTRRRKPSGLPTAWTKANRKLVDLVRHETGLPKTSPHALSRNSDTRASSDAPRTAFDYTAALWGAYGIPVTSEYVYHSYHDKRKPKAALRRK
jgi:hypothetical protein